MPKEEPQLLLRAQGRPIEERERAYGQRRVARGAERVDEVRALLGVVHRGEPALEVLEEREVALDYRRRERDRGEIGAHRLGVKAAVGEAGVGATARRQRMVVSGSRASRAPDVRQLGPEPPPLERLARRGR